MHQQSNNNGINTIDNNNTLDPFRVYEPLYFPLFDEYLTNEMIQTINIKMQEIENHPFTTDAHTHKHNIKEN